MVPRAPCMGEHWQPLVGVHAYPRACRAVMRMGVAEHVMVLGANGHTNGHLDVPWGRAPELSVARMW